MKRVRKNRTERNRKQAIARTLPPCNASAREAEAKAGPRTVVEAVSELMSDHSLK